MDRTSWAFSAIASIAIIALALVAILHAPRPAAATSHLTVTGTGYVNVVPDTATITVGVQKNAATVQAAQSAADAIMAKMVAAEKALGIPAADLQTEGYNVGQYYTPNTGRQSGYQVSENLQITLTGKTSLAGAAVSAATKAGANMVQGISWSVAHPQEAMGEAYARALANARATAKKLAKNLGVSLMSVTSVSVEGSQAPSPVFYRMAAVAAPAAPVSPGTQKVSETLRVVFTFGPAR